MRTLTLLICFGWLVPASADYRSEINLGFVWGNIDSGYNTGYIVPDYTPPANTDTPTNSPIDPPVGPIDVASIDEDYSGWNVDGQWFFAPVDTSLGPQQLAEFMSRASSIGGAYSSLEGDDSNFEIETWQVYTHITLGEAWVATAAFGSADATQSRDENDIDLYHVALGYYIAQYTRLRTGYNRENGDNIEYDRWSIDVNHVQQLENGMTWQASVLYGSLRGKSEIGQDDDGSDIEINMSWYFNDQFGVGADYDIHARDATGDTDRYSLWANYFVSEKISLKLSHNSEENDDFNVDSSNIMFEAKYRL